MIQRNSRSFPSTVIRRSLLGLALAASVGLAPAQAAIYCAENLAQLRTALADADGDGINDTIRVTQNTYSVSGSSLSTFVAAGESLVIEGGWMSVFGSCNQLLDDASLTVIDGLAQRPVLSIEGTSGAGSITVRNLTIRNGLQSSGAGATGAGLTIRSQAAHSGQVTVERVYFSANQTAGFGAGLYIDVNNNATVRSSVFRGNLAATSAAMYVGTEQTSYLVNNTVFGNFATTPNIHVASAGFNGPSTILSNNIFYNNLAAGQQDVFASAALTFFGNNIEQIFGSPAGASAGNVSVNPGFRSASDLRLRDDSPMVNTGINAPLGGAGSLDLDGHARVTGRTDLGAYENDRYFANGFE